VRLAGWALSRSSKRPSSDHRTPDVDSYFAPKMDVSCYTKVSSFTIYFISWVCCVCLSSCLVIDLVGNPIIIISWVWFVLRREVHMSRTTTPYGVMMHHDIILDWCPVTSIRADLKQIVRPVFRKRRRVNSCGHDSTHGSEEAGISQGV
jgi:hypothetical protein